MMFWLLALSAALANGTSTDEPPAPDPVEASVPEPPAEPVPVPKPVPAPTAVKLRVDADRSQVYALLYKKGAASALSHDHVIEARQVSGTATLDPSNPAASRVRIEVSVTGLFPDSDEMRDQLDLPRSISEKQRDEILGHLYSEGQLFLERYDKITFVSTAMSGTAEALEVRGDFTLRGVTRQITVPMAVAREGDAYRAWGGFRILQSDYGYEPYRALLGALQNKDEADIVLDVWLTPAR